MPDNGNANIRVEITDAREFHCFRLVLNPRFEECQNCEGRGAVMIERSLYVHEEEHFDQHECPTCRGEGKLLIVGSGLEIMLHARSLVDLIHKCSLALCDWQAQTCAALIERLHQVMDRESTAKIERNLGETG